MKRITTVIAALLAAALLVGCQTKKPSNDNEGNNHAQNNATEQSTKTDDASANVKVTLDSVSKAKTSPEGDFDVSSYNEETCVITKYLGSDAIVSIPEKVGAKSVVEIGGSTFSYASTVRGILVPGTIEKIGKVAFANNEKIEIVCISGNGLKKIADSAFLNCTALHTVVLNEGLESIGNLAFVYCNSLKEIEIPSSVSEISVTAFGGNAEGFTIVGTPGSYAEQYATENGINFRAK